MDLKGKTVAVLVEQQYQELEVWYPYYRLKEAGANVLLVGPEAGKTYPSKLGYPAKADKASKDVSASTIDGVVVPGGFAPDFFRRDPATIQLVKDVFARKIGRGNLSRPLASVFDAGPEGQTGNLLFCHQGRCHQCRRQLRR